MPAFAQKSDELGSDEAGPSDDDDLHVGISSGWVAITALPFVSDADVVPEGAAEVLADALKCRPICLEDFTKGSGGAC
jgi:hypothetical protein